MVGAIAKTLDLFTRMCLWWGISGMGVRDMQLTEREIEHIIKEIIEAAERQTAPITDGERKEKIIAGLKERLQKIGDINEDAKQRLIGQLSERYAKQMQLFNEKDFDRLCSKLDEFVNSFPHWLLICPECKKESLVAEISSFSITENKKAYTGVFNFRCLGFAPEKEKEKDFNQCDWQARNIGLLYITDKDDKQYYDANPIGGFDLQDELDKKELDYNIKYIVKT
jgi:hypothetical protein